VLSTSIPPQIWLKTGKTRAQPIAEGYRKLYNDKTFGHYAEYFYNEAERLFPEIKVPVNRFDTKN